MPADLLEKVRSIAQAKRLPEHFLISVTKGLTPNDFTKITAWRIMLSYNVPDEKTAFRSFVIRDWDDDRNHISEATRESEPKNDKEISAPYEFSSPFNLLGNVEGVDRSLFKKFEGTVDAVTLFKLDEKPFAIVGTGEAKIQADGSYNLSYGMTDEEAERFLSSDGKVFIRETDIGRVTRSTIIIARLPGHFSRNLGTEIRDGTTRTLDLGLLPTTRISVRVFYNGKPFR